MNTNDNQDFYNEVEKEDIDIVIEPVADDDIPVGMGDSVHLIGGEAFGDDAIGDFAADAFVMDVDSDGVFDFDVADNGNDGLIDDVEVLDMDSLDDTGYDDAVVMDVDIDGDFDFAVADVNNDGFINTDDVLVTLDEASGGGYIGHDASTVPDEDLSDLEHPEDPVVDEDWEVEESDGSEIIETTEDLYPDDNDIDYMTDDIIDL